MSDGPASAATTSAVLDEFWHLVWSSLSDILGLADVRAHLLCGVSKLIDGDLPPADASCGRCNSLEHSAISLDKILSSRTAELAAFCQAAGMYAANPCSIDPETAGLSMTSLLTRCRMLRSLATLGSTRVVAEPDSVPEPTAEPSQHRPQREHQPAEGASTWSVRTLDSQQPGYACAQAAAPGTDLTSSTEWGRADNGLHAPGYPSSNSQQFMPCMVRDFSLQNCDADTIVYQLNEASSQAMMVLYRIENCRIIDSLQRTLRRTAGSNRFYASRFCGIDSTLRWTENMIPDDTTGPGLCLEPPPTSVEVVYADGSYGRETRTGGVGCFFGLGDPRNVSESFAGARDSFHVEAEAVLRALQRSTLDLVIVSDCKELIAAMEGCKHREELRDDSVVAQIKALMESRTGRLWMYWIKSHEGNPGNEFADRLASSARRCRGSAEPSMSTSGRNHVRLTRKRKWAESQINDQPSERMPKRVKAHGKAGGRYFSVSQAEPVASDPQAPRQETIAATNRLAGKYRWMSRTNGSEDAATATDPRHAEGLADESQRPASGTSHEERNDSSSSEESDDESTSEESSSEESSSEESSSKESSSEESSSEESSSEESSSEESSSEESSSKESSEKSA